MKAQPFWVMKKPATGLSQVSSFEVRVLAEVLGNNYLGNLDCRIGREGNANEKILQYGVRP